VRIGRDGDGARNKITRKNVGYAVHLLNLFPDCSNHDKRDGYKESDEKEATVHSHNGGDYASAERQDGKRDKGTEKHFKTPG
jgi:transposase InsO family protein